MPLCDKSAARAPPSAAVGAGAPRRHEAPRGRTTRRRAALTTSAPRDGRQKPVATRRCAAGLRCARAPALGTAAATGAAPAAARLPVVRATRAHAATLRPPLTARCHPPPPPADAWLTSANAMPTTAAALSTAAGLPPTCCQPPPPPPASRQPALARRLMAKRMHFIAANQARSHIAQQVSNGCLASRALTQFRPKNRPC